MPRVEVREVVAHETVVVLLVGDDAVGVGRAEQGAGERLPRARIDLRALYGQLLPPFGAVGGQFVLGEAGVQQDLLGDLQRAAEVARERAEAEIGVVAVDADVVVGAEEVEPFGDLAGREVAAPFGQQVGRGRGDERLPLPGRAGTEQKRNAGHFEVVRSERIEIDAVGQRAVRGLHEFDGLGGPEGRLCHLHGS